MTWLLSQRSEGHLSGIHPDLVNIVRRALALSSVDFTVIEGLRTPERQRQLVASGASRTMFSRHLTGHAVDIAPWINHSIPWDNWPSFERVAQAMKQASLEMSIPLVWGGDWTTFRDGPHFELPREAYP